MIKLSDKQMMVVVIGVTFALFLYTVGTGCCNRCKKKLPCCKMNDNKTYQGSF